MGNGGMGCKKIREVLQLKTYKGVEEHLGHSRRFSGNRLPTNYADHYPLEVGEREVGGRLCAITAISEPHHVKVCMFVCIPLSNCMRDGRRRLKRG